MFRYTLCTWVATVCAGPAAVAAAECPRKPLVAVGPVQVWKTSSGAVAFRGALQIDADGAPNAYGPEGKGLDFLANAGKPGHWWGLVAEAGNPVVQSEGDPFPGYYVSTTSLEDRRQPVTRPARYVDATRIPYLALPPQVMGKDGVKLGDFAAVIELSSGRVAFAIVADVGPRERIGEGSIALADALGIPSDPKRGGARRGVAYLVFRRSGDGRPKSARQIEAAGRALLVANGGVAAPTACSED
jgi:hypothetical protein